MSHTLVIAIATGLGLACSTSIAGGLSLVEGGGGGASWAKKRIERFESSGGQELAQTIQKYTYGGQSAYLFTSPCCDQFNYLYDAEGRILCAPTGGFAGRGDGRCVEPLGPPKPAASPPKAGAK